MKKQRRQWRNWRRNGYKKSGSAEPNLIPAADWDWVKVTERLRAVEDESERRARIRLYMTRPLPPIQIVRWIGAYRNVGVRLEDAIAFEMQRRDCAAAAAQFVLRPVGFGCVGILLDPRAVQTVWTGDAYTESTPSGRLESIDRLSGHPVPSERMIALRVFASVQERGTYAEVEVTDIRRYARALVVAKRDPRLIKRVKRIARQYGLSVVVL